MINYLSIIIYLSFFIKISFSFFSKNTCNSNTFYTKCSNPYVLNSINPVVRLSSKDQSKNDIELIIDSLKESFKEISQYIKRKTLLPITNGKKETNINIHGEKQNEIDIISNSIIKKNLCSIKNVEALASEEENEPYYCSRLEYMKPESKYAVVFDPLDGSKNIHSSFPTGSIFGIYNNTENKSLTQQGKHLVAAGYCLYSSSTIFVYAKEEGVNIFSLEELSNEFYELYQGFKMPISGNILSLNFANEASWNPNIQKFLYDTRRLKFQKLKYRYIGAFVADIHNILINGGLFGYPSNDIYPNGKIRLLYEANPIAFLVEKAGGLAIDGNKMSILEKPFRDVHAKTDIFIGSEREIFNLKEYL